MGDLLLDESGAGQEFAGYRIERLLGRGGMGVVYLAEHIHLGRKVALKFLGGEAGADSVEFRERFIRESRLAASLAHPNIVTVYDAGEHDGRLYIAMQYIDGTDLASVLKERGAVDPERTVEALEQVASALDAAHAEGLVHRDVKPANVLIKDRQSYLTDFGLTKHTHGTRALTQTGQFLGTLEYMAPEQAEGGPVDHRCDVYALGCMLYHSLTGSVPFQRDTTVATIWAHLSEPPPRASMKADVPKAFDAVIDRAMAKDPANRFQSAGDVARAARAAIGGVKPDPPPTRRRKLGRTAPAFRPPAVADRRGRGRVLAAGGAALAALLAIVLVLALGGGGDKRGRANPVAVGPLRAKRIPLQSNSFWVAADPANSSVWVSGLDRNLVSRVDTGTEAATERPLHTDDAPLGLAVGRAGVWIPTYHGGSVYRLPGAREIGRPRRVRVGGRPSQIAVTLNYAWVADERGVVKRLDPDTMRLSGTPTVVGKGSGLVAADAAGAWVARHTAGTVTRIDPEGRIRGKPIRVGTEPSGIAIGEGFVWVTNAGDGTVTRIDARTGKVTGRPIPVGRGPFGVAVGAGFVWVTNVADNTVSRIDPRTARAVGRPIRVGPAPFSVAVGDHAVWVGSKDSQTVSVIHLGRSKGDEGG